MLVIIGFNQGSIEFFSEGVDASRPRLKFASDHGTATETQSFGNNTIAAADGGQAVESFRVVGVGGDETQADSELAMARETSTISASSTRTETASATETFSLVKNNVAQPPVLNWITPSADGQTISGTFQLNVGATDQDSDVPSSVDYYLWTPYFGSTYSIDKAVKIGTAAKSYGYPLSWDSTAWNGLFDIHAVASDAVDPTVVVDYKISVHINNTAKIETGICKPNTPFTNAEIDKIKLCTKWIRTEIHPGAIWATQTSFNADNATYGSLLSSIQYAKSQGMKVLMQINYCGGFMGPFMGTPTNMDAWAECARRIVRDLGQWVDAYEIWNEPNNNSFWANCNPVSYRQLLRKAILAMRSQNSKAYIMNGGIMAALSRTDQVNLKWDAGIDNGGTGNGDANGTSPATFMDGMFSSTDGIVPGRTPGTPYLDAYAIHAYNTGESVPTDFPPLVNGRNHWADNELVKAFQNDPSPHRGDPTLFPNGYNYYDHIITAHEGANHGKVIFQTEAGYPSAGSQGSATYSLSAQATHADQALAYWKLRAAEGKVGAYIWFLLRDQTSGDMIETGAGIYTASDTNMTSPKPVFNTLKSYL